MGVPGQWGWCSTSHPVEGRAIAGRYRLERSLGRWGNVERWIGTDTVLARPVAVELFDATEPTHAVARLHHPTIAAVFDSGRDGGRTFVVTEPPVGASLAELARPGGMPLAHAVAAVTQVADALAHAHAAGMAHGALTADTVTWHDGRAQVRGFRRSPAEPADIAADVAALGALAFEALTGHTPDEVGGLRPRQLRAGIPRTLDDAVMRALGGGYRTVADFRADLAAIDVADDDAVPLVVPDDTPPRGVAPSFRQTERAWLLPAAVIILVATALGLAGTLVARTDVGRLLPGNFGRPAAPAPLRVVAVSTFDPPPGDGHERDAEARRVIDGDPTTAWRTQRYTRPDLGGLKPGVGLMLRLDRPRPLDQLIVRSPTNGWAAEVYLGDPAPTLAGWGRRVAAHDDIAGAATFSLGGRRASALLLWITRLGPVPGGWAVVISDVQVLGRA